MTMNPVFINDMRRNWFRRRPIHATAAMAVLILILTVGMPVVAEIIKLVSGGFISSASSIPLWRYPELALPVIVPAFTAGAFAREREQRTWFEILLTPLKPGEILRGKFFAALIPTLATIIVLIPPMLMGMIMSGTNWGMDAGPWMLIVGFKILANSVFYVSLVLLSSYFCSNARVSLVVSYVVLSCYGFANYFIWTVIAPALLALFYPAFDASQAERLDYTIQQNGPNMMGMWPQRSSGQAWQVSQSQFVLSAPDTIHLVESLVLSVLILWYLRYQIGKRRDEKTA